MMDSGNALINRAHLEVWLLPECFLHSGLFWSLQCSRLDPSLYNLLHCWYKLHWTFPEDSNIHWNIHDIFHYIYWCCCCHPHQTILPKPLPLSLWPHPWLLNFAFLQIIKFKDQIQDISTTASNEATLERMLLKIMDLWQGTDFRLLPHASGSVVIIAGADDILAMLEESQVTIGTIRGSRYVSPIKVSSLNLTSCTPKWM